MRRAGFPRRRWPRVRPVFADAELASDIAAGMRQAASAARPGDRIVVCGSFLAVAPALHQLGLY